MTRRQAMDLIRYHGLMLESAKGFEPSFAERVAGQPIKGSWWGHSRGHQIYELTQKIHQSNAVLVCTVAKGRITYIHRRLWPFFVHLSSNFPKHSLDKVREIHLPSGRHTRQDIAFPDWVPEKVTAIAGNLSLEEAEKGIAIWLKRYGNA